MKQDFHDDIAIVGMSCKLPRCTNLEEFWNALEKGEDLISIPPDDRYLQKDYPTKISENCRKVYAGFIPWKVDEFDAAFFGISPMEAVFMDPQQRLLHELVWEGLEDAGIDPLKLKGTNGAVFTGSWTNDYKDILLRCGYEEFYRRYMGNSIGAASAKIAFHLGMTGPCISTESGCSSGMVAVHLACKSLQRGETNLALACGVNLLLKPFYYDELPQMLAADGRCKPFDIRADGFGRAEGGGVFVLKRLSDAVKDYDRIWAVIKGSAISQEGLSKSMGTPTVHSESLAMELALKDAGIHPSQVSLIEAHGTGTPVGDPIEVLAIAKAYGTEKREMPLLITSVKGNVGHTESASGITGMIKVILSMKHKKIPRQVNLIDLNPSIDLGFAQGEIPLTQKNWNRSDKTPRIAGVSSFGITGTDAHVILEEPPTTAKETFQSKIERPCHILKVTAKTEGALDILLGRYKEYIMNSGDALPDIAFTANTCRTNLKCRAVITGKSTEEIVGNIEKGRYLKEVGSFGENGKICFLFTGQGSQYSGMAQQIYNTSPIFQDAFDVCADFLQENYQINIKEAIWSKNSEYIQKTIYSQTSIFCLEYALIKLWESWGVKPDYVLGHSLGEFSAAVCANILNIEEALTLVAERSTLIDQLPPGKMLVVKAEKKVVETTLQKFSQNNQTEVDLDCAAFNSNEQTVVAGDSQEIMAFSKWCDDHGLKNVVLKSNHAFHSRLMDSVLEQYRKVAKKTRTVRGNQYKCKYISGMLGKLVEDDSCFNADYCVEHTRKPVLFLEASQTAAREGCNIFVEIGPQPVLSALTMSNITTIVTCLPSLKRNDEDWSTLLNSVGSLYVNGIEIDWAALDKPYCKRERVPLPHYPFIGKRFWPEIADTQNSSIHPLLGAPIISPLSSKLFHSGINLKNLPFLKDHVVGEHVVFPGVGYLEMCLAAGIASFEDPSVSLTKFTRPISVKNLTIDAPLIFNDSSACEMHTVVDPGVSDDVSVKIFHRLDSGKWVLHANAEIEILTSYSLQEIKKLVHSSPILKSQGDKESMEQLYGKLASVGLNFGDTFRSLDTIWKSDNQKESIKHVFKVKSPTEEHKSEPFLIHPVILDAMVQAYIFDRLIYEGMDKRKKMPLPVKIGKFVVLPASPNHKEDNYVHILTVKNEKDVEKIAVLADSDGQVKCVMSQVEFVDTTIKYFDAIVRQHTSNQMPDLWGEVWKQKDDFSTCHFHPEKTLQTNIFSEHLQLKMTKLNKNPPDQACKVYKLLGQLSFLHMMKTLLELGWSMELGSTFETTELRKSLGIIDEHHQYFGFILNSFESKGLISKVRDGGWKLATSLPSLDTVKSEIMSPAFTVDLVEQFTESSSLLSRIGDNLSDILRGDQSPLNILFPVLQHNCPLPTAAEWYREYAKMSGFETMAKDALSERMNHFTDAMGGQRFVLRILEVGAGTGGFTEILLEVLEDAGVDFEYTYTDISSSFFPAAERKFRKHSNHMKFLKFNIEEDPLTQGLMPEYYDYICGHEVIHATKNIQDALENLRMVLKPYGKLDITDSTKINIYVTFIYGLLSGYWRFEDHRILKSHCTMDTQTWKTEFTLAGYKVEQVFSVLDDTHSLFFTYRNGLELKSQLKVNPSWLVFHAKEVPISGYLIEKLISAGRNVRIVGEEICLNDFNSNLEGILYSFGLDKSRKSPEEILKPLFQFIKQFLSCKLQEQLKITPKLIVLTKGTVPVFGENDDLTGFNSGTLWGFCKSLGNETVDLNCCCIDIEEDCANGDEVKMNRVFQEMFIKENDLMVAFRNDSKFVPKLHAIKPLSQNQQDLTIPTRSPGKLGRFQLILPESRLISDLTFGPSEMEKLQDYDIEIQVKALSLNFRDVLAVTKPTEYFNSVSAIGIDIAGEVIKVGTSVSRWKPGDVVCSLNFNEKAFPSHVQVHEDYVMSVPPNMACCEAATLPVVFITAFLGLVEMAKLRRNEYVLIHTASGGVGLAAVDLCKNIGAQIIATAGSKVKRRYLRRLGIKHVFNSRNTSYREQIMIVTNGHGVDVVLNSLTGNGFKEATLDACAQGARFIEMSKLNVWKSEDVNILRPDLDYQIIDITRLEESTFKCLFEKMAEHVERGVTKPLPYTRFGAVNIREALHFLQKTKHIGKVVCVMPELKKVEGELRLLSPMFNDNSTYLITGGLGGIGFVVCRWMVERGAKHVVLAGRSPPKPEVSSQIDEINAKFHANCVAVELDVGDYKACESLIKERLPKMGMPPLKGIMHAAGTLADGVVVNQTWERLQLPFKAKIKGTMNLHQITLDMHFEHFVLFSSAAATFGTPGQCNHSSACHFEDGFAHYRRSIGLPATTINWGPWCEAGVATDSGFPGTQSMTNREGLMALEYALKSIRTQTVVLTIDSFERFQIWFPRSGSCMDEVNWKDSSLQTNAGSIKPKEFWVTYNSEKNIEDKEKFLKENVRNTLFSVLRMKETDFREDATFQEMGVDSLMFVEIRNRLQEIFGKKVVVSVNTLMEGGTANSVTKALLRLIEDSRNSQMN